MASSRENTSEDEALLNDEYQPINISRKVSNMGTFAHLVKVHLGVGIMGMPLVIMNSGTVLGPALISFLAFLYFLSVWILVRASTSILRKNNLSFAEYNYIADMAFESPFWSKFVAGLIGGSITLLHLSCWITYILFVVTNIKDISEYWHPQFKKDPHFGLGLTLVTSFMLMMICSVRRLEHLVPFSSGGIVVIVVSLGIMFYNIIPNSPALSSYPVQNIPRLPVAFGLVMFAFEGIGSVVSIKNSMREPKKFVPIFGIMVILYAALMIVVGILGYRHFGNKTADLLIFNMPDTSLYAAMKLLYSIALFLTYPIQCVVTNRLLVPHFNRLFSPLFEKESLVPEYIWRYTCVVVPTVIAILLPFIGDVMSLFGGLCGSIISMIVPPILHMKTLPQDWKTITVNITIMIIGVLGGVTGTFISTKSLITKYKLK